MSRLSQARKGFMQIYNAGKEAVTVIAVTETQNAQDDTVYVPTNYSTYAKLDRGMDNYIEFGAGRLPDGEYFMYFPWSFVTGLSVGNYVTYNSANYKITEVSPYNIARGLVYTKIKVAKSNISFS